MATTFSINEECSGSYRATLTDDAGAYLSGSVLSTLTLTLYAIGAGGVTQIVNGRNEQNVLNTNGVLVYDDLQTDTLSDGSTVDYNFKWAITPLDTTLVNADLSVERHVALFQWTWGSTKAGKHEVILAVKNLTLVP